jgi:hypothetical protein
MNDGQCDIYSNQDYTDELGTYQYRYYQYKPMFGQTPRSEWTSSNKFASFNVAVENRGSEYVTPIVHIAVSDPNGNEIWNVDFEGETVGPYERDTIDVIDRTYGLDKVFSFNETQMQNILTGAYTVTYSVSTESGNDPTPENNTTSHPFYITEEAYSPATPNITRTIGPNTWSNFADGDEILAYFTYYVLQNGEIPVYVYISESTTPGTEIVAKIYDNNLNLTNSSNRYTITESDLGQWVNIPLTTPLYITEFDENSTYKNVKVGIAFYENGGDNELHIGASNDMPNKGWICSYTMSGNTTSYNVTSESVAPAICLGNPNPETITTYTIDVLSANDAMGSTSGSGTYNYGEQITISATPNSGYRFTQWQDGSTTNPRTITVTGNATYIASFEALPNQYTITVLSANETMGTVNGGGVFSEGDQIRISATAHDGYNFIGWNDNNTDNPRTITVTGDATYIASFEALPNQYTITVLSANETMGTVNGGGSFSEGDEIRISATARDGYNFIGWNDNNTDNPRTITVTENATYIATFEAIPATTYTITVEIDGAYFVDDVLITYNGEIVTAPVTVEHGATPSFVIDGQMTTNGDYFNIVSIAVDGEEVELLNENFINIYTYNYTFEPVTANHTLLITFSRISSADLLDDSSMAIYPNPNNGMFSIDFSNIEGDATYQIINANGAVVETRDINVTNGENKMFNHNLSAGTYFIRIINGDKVYIEQIVVE